MKQTSKVISIDSITGECIVYSNKGELANYIGREHETVISWFRGSDRIQVDNKLYIKASKYITKDKKHK